jgi:hypothetical protein
MVKQLKTAIKHLNMGLELVFPGRVVIGYSKKKGQYYVWRGFQKTYSTKRPDDLIKKLMKKHGSVESK